MQEGEKQKMSRAEDEIEFVKKIEEKTGEITPGNALNLLTLSKQEIDRLLTVEKLSKNQRKKILKRQIWVSVIFSIGNRDFSLAGETAGAR